MPKNAFGRALADTSKVGLAEEPGRHVCRDFEATHCRLLNRASMAAQKKCQRIKIRSPEPNRLRQQAPSTGTRAERGWANQRPGLNGVLATDS